eukprot:CAMPEP_0170404322 /NCGR_PEP_ID=MMETSP0117_2-20130122/26570_1 /TAXON_ID=400756 /ORGANISM="Durinskia baltica, Strain CSIRO CS-38" /LENGTH=97 /DNA_ID=CAMNT_0010661331 /DNA_START=15 /DNA_END=308 /DNA_ORIENTATION=-
MANKIGASLSEAFDGSVSPVIAIYFVINGKYLACLAPSKPIPLPPDNQIFARLGEIYESGVYVSDMVPINYKQFQTFIANANVFNSVVEVRKWVKSF